MYMSREINITAKATEEKRYTINLNGEGLLESIHVVGPGFERRFYRRNPRQHELKLTIALFEEIVASICKVDLEEVADLEERMRGDAEFYTALQKQLIKRSTNTKNPF